MTTPQQAQTVCAVADCTYSASDGSTYCTLHGVKWGRGGAEPLSGWDREWAYVQKRADAPRPPSLGCSTISHDRLGFCEYCVRALRDGGPNGRDLELGGWRLLALRAEHKPAPAVPAADDISEPR